MSRTRHPLKRHKWVPRAPGTRSDRRPARRKDPPAEPECFLCDTDFRLLCHLRKQQRYEAAEGGRQLLEML